MPNADRRELEIHPEGSHQVSGAVIIGAGPGIGRSVALRFAREQMPVALITRTPATVADTVDAVARHGVPTVPLTADSTDEAQLSSALDAAVSQFGVPDVVVYNPAVIQADRIGHLSTRSHLNAWSVNVVGALQAAAHIAPLMARRGTGSFIITGGMPQAKAEYASLSLGKAGVRTLVNLLHQEYGDSGVHAATVTVDGPVAPGTAFDPGLIAEHYWTLHTQPRNQWDHEILHAESTEARTRK